MSYECSGGQSRHNNQHLTKYPWSKWFKQKEFRLIKGVHYRIATHSMAQLVRNNSHPTRHNVRVSISIDLDAGGMTVKVTDRPDDDYEGYDRKIKEVRQPKSKSKSKSKSKTRKKVA